MFQICLLLEEIEEIECPVTIPPGGGLDCQQRHSLPLSLMVSTSNVLSPLSPIWIRGIVSCLRDKPCFLSFFFFFVFANQRISGGSVLRSALHNLPK